MLKTITIFSFLILSISVQAQQRQHPFVYFNSGKSVPIHSNIILDKRYSQMDYFWVRGFADSTGSYELNLRLSMKRAEEVKKRLMVFYGIPESKIIMTYYGVDSRPNVPDAQKRRVEIYSGNQAQISVLASKEMGRKEPEKKEPEKKVQRKVSSEENKKKKSSKKMEEAPVKDKSSKKRYYVGAGTSHNVLKAKDQMGREAKWVSKTNLDAVAQYQFLVDKVWIGLRGNYQQRKYKQQDNRHYTWDEKSPNLYSFSLVFDREIDRFGIGLDLNYGRISFIHVNNNIVNLKDTSMFGADLRAQYKWYDGSNWSSRLGILLDYPISGSGDIKPKGEIGYIGFVDLRRSEFISDHGLNLKLYYGMKNYKTTQSKQKDRMIGFQILFMSPNWQ